MSLGPVSSQVPRSIEHQQVFNPRLQVNAGEEGSCLSTVLKTAFVFAVVYALVASFTLGGPIVGVAIILVCGAGLCGFFNTHFRHIGL